MNEINIILNELSDKHLELKDQIDELQLKDDAVKNEIKLILESNNMSGFEDENDYYISFTTQSQTRLDKALVEKMLPPEQFKECFKTGNEFTTLRWNKKRDKVSK